MLLFFYAAALLSAACSVYSALPDADTSRQILPKTFQPPKVFKNVNLVRTINLEKGYVRESLTLVIENIDKAPQSDYYFVFDADTIGKVGGLEVRDKKEASSPPFKVQLAEVEVNSPTQFYQVSLHKPLAPGAQQTLVAAFHILSSLEPLPAQIAQKDKQYLKYTFSSFSPSAYDTSKQRTKIKFGTVDIPDYTGKPERQGTSYTYGPYDNVPAGAEQIESVRYDYTKPVMHATLMERDVEVSHWGGNIAFEERYWLTNQAATLSKQFSRLQWQQTAYYTPASSALIRLLIPLRAGSQDAYFTDEIGNISTSTWKSNDRESTLELKPRYPIFGGWNHRFTIGWNHALSNFLRTTKTGNTYVLRVPFIDGPKMPEGISYDKVNVRIILPEGAINIKYETAVPVISSEISSHKTFMDTLGRPTVALSASNINDEARDKSVTITYEYPFLAGFRKPLTITAGVMAVFAAAWAIGNIDVSIGNLK